MFITFEGIEGVGKSTHLRFVAQLLEKAGRDVLVTREPGGTTIGDDIRNILLSHQNNDMTALTELLLMFAARAQHIDKVIQPALSEGKWVLCDRFVDSSYAYQGGGRGIPDESIAILENLVVQDLKPVLTFIFDAPVELGLKRARNRGSSDRIEREKVEFFERAVKSYHSHATKNPERYEFIDATRSLSEIQNHLSKIIERILVKS